MALNDAEIIAVAVGVSGIILILVGFIICIVLWRKKNKKRAKRKTRITMPQPAFLPHQLPMTPPAIAFPAAPAFPPHQFAMAPTTITLPPVPEVLPIFIEPATQPVFPVQSVFAAQPFPQPQLCLEQPAFSASVYTQPSVLPAPTYTGEVSPRGLISPMEILAQQYRTHMSISPSYREPVYYIDVVQATGAVEPTQSTGTAESFEYPPGTELVPIYSQTSKPLIEFNGDVITQKFKQWTDGEWWTEQFAKMKRDIDAFVLPVPPKPKPITQEDVDAFFAPLTNAFKSLSPDNFVLPQYQPPPPKAETPQIYVVPEKNIIPSTEPTSTQSVMSPDILNYYNYYNSLNYNTPTA